MSRHSESKQIDRFHRLESLDAQRVFTLLRPFLRELDPQLRPLAVREIKMQILPARNGVSVELLLPEFKGPSEPLNVLNEQFANLREQYGKQMGRNATVDRGRGFEQAATLLGGLAGLLLTGYSLSGEKPAQAAAGEYLAVSDPGLTQEQAGTLFAHMAMQSTAARWSVAEVGGRPRYFFCGKSDRSRNGNWESLAPELQSQFQILRAFRRDTFTVFLPERLAYPLLGEAEPEVIPGVDVLSQMKELLEECPEVLALPLSEDGVHHSVLLAVLPAQNSGLNHTADNVLRADLLALPAGRFHRNYFLDPEYQRIHVTPQNLEFTATAHEGLRSHLKRQKGCEGYRLELRDTGLRTWEQDIGEIYRRYQDYEYKYRLWSEANAVRPALMRFSHDQLPELARLLRALPLRTLNSAGLSYACFTPQEASPTSPADADPISELSYHYLYFDHGWSDLAEVAPLLNFARQCERPGVRTKGRPETMRFWLDPFWARSYHTGGSRADTPGENRCLVFVPEAKALFPTLHGWDPAEMEAYLRDVLTDFLSPGQKGMLGSRPLFLFDGPYGPDDDRICITLLDRNEFKPFRQRLDWVNDHLDILEAIDSDKERRVAVTAKISGMANLARWEVIADELASRGRPAQDRVEAVARQSHQEVLELVRGELSVFDAQLNDAFQRLQTVLEQAQKLNAETVELRAFLRAAESARNEMLGSARRLQQTTTSGVTSFEEWEKKAAETLERFRVSRIETEDSIRKSATELAESRKRILAFLSQLW